MYLNEHKKFRNCDQTNHKILSYVVTYMRQLSTAQIPLYKYSTYSFWKYRSHIHNLRHILKKVKYNLMLQNHHNMQVLHASMYHFNLPFMPQHISNVWIHIVNNRTVQLQHVLLLFTIIWESLNCNIFILILLLLWLSFLPDLRLNLPFSRGSAIFVTYFLDDLISHGKC